MSEILVKEFREDVLENIHIGHICIVDYSGKVRYSAGDPKNMTYLRSSAKPIQALPVIKRDLHKWFGLTERETTIFAASHMGESFHVDAVESILHKIGMAEDDLVMLPTYPGNRKERERLLRIGMGPRKIYHNCSGKHSGILTLCRGLDLPTEGYWEIDHPAQKEILTHIAMMGDCSEEDIKIGIDGCGVPVFAMPLISLAKAYLKLACPELIEDEDISSAAFEMSRLMNEYGEMIGGTDTLCTTLLEDSNIVAKGGAQGVYCFALRRERLGFAIKLMDGTAGTMPIIIASILEMIDYRDSQIVDTLYRLFPVDIKNDNENIVGRKEVVFTI
ncbi:MAG: asparaginase [Clostridiales bacterium]|nr:asparaginase [Clostridiales bacterium]